MVYERVQGRGNGLGMCRGKGEWFRKVQREGGMVQDSVEGGGNCLGKFREKGEWFRKVLRIKVQEVKRESGIGSGIC